MYSLFGGITLANRTPLSSSELGTLWLTYQEKTMIISVLTYLIEKADDEKAKDIMVNLLEKLEKMCDRITKVFIDEGAVVPIGFTEEDVFLDAPKLFDKGLDIMIVRVFKEISMGLYTLHINMAYREDVFKIYNELTAITQKCYYECTEYLLERGLLCRPSNVPMPKDVQYIDSKHYLSGLNPFNTKRQLNTIEVGYLHHGIEANNVGMQIVTGFAQCAKTEDAKKLFRKGMKIAESIVKAFEEVLIESHIPISNSSGGIVTRSKVAPFSDKLMMNIIFFLNSFGMGSQSFGSVFSLRYDLSTKFLMAGKDVYFYNDDCVKVMIKHGWLERPPAMADRNQLTK
jgi:hypothetical protein